MRQYAPSKKFILLVLALLVLGGTFWVFRNNSKKNQTNYGASGQLNNGPVVAEEISKDSDADGLKDWEEALWKTDPNNRDTDNDGTPDGQEIKENRNPLVAGDGKSDKLAIQNFSKTGENATQTGNTSLMNSAPSTLTEAIGQNLLSSYFLTKQQKADGTLSEKDKSAIVNSITKSFQNIFSGNTSLQGTYQESDVRYSNNSASSIREYGNNLASAIKKYFDPLPETEMAIFNKAMVLAGEKSGEGDLNDEAVAKASEEISKLGPLANAYGNSAKKIISMAVPPNFAEKHLALANAFSSISSALEAMEKIFDDPAGGMAGVNRYQTDAEKAYQILLGANDYFLKNRVAFKAGEPGELFAIYPELQLEAESTVASLKTLPKN